MARLYGARQPRVQVLPDGDWDFGDARDAAEFMHALKGWTLVPWQQDVLDWMMAVDRHGNPAAEHFGLSVPRQNGKTVAAWTASLYWSVVLGHNVLWTAQEVKTAKRAWSDILKLADPRRPGAPLADQVDNISRVNGELFIEWVSGGVWFLSARSTDAARGFSFDKVFLDEAYDSPSNQQDAMMPLTSSCPSGVPQFVLLSSPPVPGRDPHWFAATRSSVLDGSDTESVWWEYSAHPDAEKSAPETWAVANPRLGHGLLLKSVRKEHTKMTAGGFSRERLGQWPEDVKHQHVVDMEVWDSLADTSSTPVGDLGVGVDLSPDGRTACVVIAGVNRAGAYHFEVAQVRSGDPGWVAGWLGEFVGASGRVDTPVRAIVVDDKYGARPLKPAIEDATGVAVTGAWSTDHAAACGLWLLSVGGGRVAHLGQKQIDDALRVAVKRDLAGGQGWLWDRSEMDADITPVVAMTLALHGLTSSKVARQAERRTNKVYMGSRW